MLQISSLSIPRTTFQPQLGSVCLHLYFIPIHWNGSMLHTLICSNWFLSRHYQLSRHFRTPAAPLGEQFSILALYVLESHTVCYCNNGCVCFEAGGDALKCCVSLLCSLGGTQFKTDQVCLSWPGPPYALSCFALVLVLPAACTEKRWKYRSWREGKTASNNENRGAICFLTSKTPTPTSPPANGEAGSDIESCVGGWTVGRLWDVRPSWGWGNSCGQVFSRLSWQWGTDHADWCEAQRCTSASLWPHFFVAPQNCIFAVTGQEFYAQGKAVRASCVIL